MNTTVIRKKLHNYLEVADSKKIKAIYTMEEDDIAENKGDYTEAERAELDKRVNYYLNGGKMITATVMNKRLKAAREKK